MDRERAKRHLSTGLWLGLGAALLFGLVFVIATVYIASA
jgi:Na+-driven multidrug efflux pump